MEETDQAKLDRSKATSIRAQSNKVSGQGFSGLSDQGTPCQVSVVKAQRSKDAMPGFKVEETDQAKLDRSKATSNRVQSNKSSRPVFTGAQRNKVAMPGFKVEETDQAKLDRSKAASNKAQSNKSSRPVFSGSQRNKVSMPGYNVEETNQA